MKYAKVWPKLTLLALAMAILFAARSGESTVTHSVDFSSTYNLDTLSWEGHTWAIRGTNEEIVGWGGPQAAHPETGESYWVDGATVDDAGDLVLESRGINGGVELIAEESLGYGTYYFRYSADFDAFDPHTVLGIFTYDWADVVVPGHKAAAGVTEIDFIEISRWGDTARQYSHGGETMYTDTDGTRINLNEFDVPEGHQELTTTATWAPDLLRVVTTQADGTILSHAVATEGVPQPNKEQLHLNLWTTTADPGHVAAQGDTVTFHAFGFTPLGP
ncbi:hypothetical protein [Corynebacterium cystitidis]|uniref:Glycosyl hydrolases family 16 n=1 Tax=Corynebacterium cystitidis DSM 20524 TaxID=1121357 RepID=A0A1H9TYA4_9CORY|nr:hypothetical protein [Corynebacterium cystitidis]WJY81893.1 hypothetical protein CCYS_04735 [Corynebacterium cystitidis DSM 20524]SES02099.1 hypothetical protein SAMN05661109_01615 [Corynebacterium cystitidis DSM 20524]SNV82353.1 Uncharacterised protein [Corynebacterium cystitidis]